MPHRLVKYSGIIFSATVVANLLAYLFHVYMARSLGVVEYGILGSLLAAFYILFVPLGAISVIVAKFVSEFKAKEEYGKVASLLFSAVRKLSLYAIVIFIGLSLISWLIANFLKIPSPIPVILMALTFVLAVILLVLQGVLRGLQKFNQLGLNISLEALIRLLIGVALVFLGLGVNGAIFAYSMGYLAAIVLALIPLEPLLHLRNDAIDISSIYRFSLPALTVSACLAVMTNIDIIFVKHFFASEEAGIYTIASVLGKAIFFFSIAFTIPMFPLVSELHVKGENTAPLLKKSLFFVIFLSGIAITIYWLFPSFIVNVLYGDAYSAAIPLLGFIGIAMSLIALVMVYTSYLMALKDMRFVKVLIVCTFLEVLLLSVFHNSLLQVIYILVLTAALTLLLLIILGLKLKKKMNYPSNKSYAPHLPAKRME